MSDQNNLPADQGGGNAEPDDFDNELEALLASRQEPSADDAGGENGATQEQDDAGVEDQPGSQEEAREDPPAGGDSPPAGQPSTDIWDNAPPELKAAHEAALREAQTKQTRLVGQISAADRELARLRREREAAAGTQGTQGQQGQAPTPAENPFESDEIKRIREEYGEVAGPILDLLLRQQQQIEAVRAPVEQAAHQQATQARQSELEIFVSAHPDYEEYLGEDVTAWVSTKPKAFQDAYARAVNVEDGQEAAWLLTEYKKDRGITAAAPTPTPTPGQQQLPQTRNPKRERQLLAGRDGGRSAPAVQSGVPDDFDGAADAFIAKKQRERGGVSM